MFEKSLEEMKSARAHGAAPSLTGVVTARGKSGHQHMGLNLHCNWQQQRHCLVTNSLPFPYYVAGGLDGTHFVSDKPAAGVERTAHLKYFESFLELHEFTRCSDTIVSGLKSFIYHMSLKLGTEFLCLI